MVSGIWDASRKPEEGRRWVVGLVACRPGNEVNPHNKFYTLVGKQKGFSTFTNCAKFFQKPKPRNPQMKFSVLLLSLSFLLLSKNHVNAQSLKGGKSFEVGLGFRGSGFNAFGYGAYALSQLVKVKAGAVLGQGVYEDINYNYLSLDGIGTYNLKAIRKVLSINALGGISFNGDLINDFETETYDKQFSFNYGVLAGLEGDFQISRSVFFVLSAQQRYYIKKDFGHWRYQIGAAVRYSF